MLIFFSCLSFSDCGGKIWQNNAEGLCHIRCIDTNTVCKNSAYDKEECSTMGKFR